MPRNITEKLDASDTVFFQLETDSLKAKSYDILYGRRGAREAFPISYDADEGADTVSYAQYDRAGIAKVITDYSDDLPSIDIAGKKFYQPVRDIGASYSYSNKEIRRSNMVGKSLETRKATATVQAMEDKLNQIAWYGEAEFGLIGYFDNANIPLGNAINGLWSDPARTPDEIYEDIKAEVIAVSTQSLDVHTATEVWLPIEQYGIVKGTRMSSGTDTTIAQFAETNLDVTFKKFIELAGAGASNADRMVVLERNADNFTLEIPMELRVLPPEPVGLSHKINNMLAIGGVIVYYPMSQRWVDGI